MANFDETLAELQKHVDAITAVLEKHPNIVREVAAAVDGAPDPKVVEGQAQDEARANALRTQITKIKATVNPKRV